MVCHQQNTLSLLFLKQTFAKAELSAKVKCSFIGQGYLSCPLRVRIKESHYCPNYSDRISIHQKHSSHHTFLTALHLLLIFFTFTSNFLHISFSCPSQLLLFSPLSNLHIALIFGSFLLYFRFIS